MMLGILQYLWDGREVFAEQLELMKTAQTEEYLHSGGCELEIAQKYGAQVYDGVMNVCVAGIVYTDCPYLLVVYTRGVGGAGQLMGELCELLTDYELSRQAAAEPEPLEADIRPLLLQAMRLAYYLSRLSPLPLF